MDKHTQTVIDELFQRLNHVEKHNTNRDRDAESLIEKHVVQQPSAPYYMAQTMIMQEATIKQLHSQVEALQTQLEQEKQKPSGGFFSRVFGGNQRRSSNTRRANFDTRGPSFGSNQYGPQTGGYPPNYGGGYQRNNSFLGGALQTAAGVAGGMMLGNMMMDMFSGHRPEEIVNIINDDPTQSMGDPNDMMNQSDFMNNGMGSEGFGPAGFDNSSFADQNIASDNMDPNTMGGFDNNDFNDPFSNGFGGDDSFGGGFDDGGFGGGDFDDFN